MSSSRLILLVTAGLIVISGIYLAVTFNKLVGQEESVNLAWSELQNVYKRRADMVPSLVTIVKGAASFEKSLLEEVAAARSRTASLASSSLSAEDYQKQEEAQSQLATSMNRVIAIVEAYPDLKSSKSFLYLQSQLEGTERRIKFARKDFNTSVNEYNTSVRQFPSSLVATLTGFKLKEGFKSDSGSEAAPEVQFNLK
ncbi:MAG: LemA family protein [Bacteroidota bacterium]